MRARIRALITSLMIMIPVYCGVEEGMDQKKLLEETTFIQRIDDAQFVIANRMEQHENAPVHIRTTKNE